jgi:glycosyltransferase involved in cell wall biosynthesis
MSQPAQVSVVIPCYERADLVRKAVLSAFDQDLPAGSWEILVVDSSPTESVTKVIEELRPQAPVTLKFFRKRPEGPGPSRNLGAENAAAPFVAFLDSDCQATRGWLRAAIAAFEDGIGIVQGRTLPDPGERQGVLSHTIRVESESFLYETANIVYRKQCLVDTGGFWADWTPNAETPLGGEDVDLGWRVRKKGWRSVFAADALVYHAILPMKPIHWVWISRLQVFPYLLRAHPELRQFLVARVFYDLPQAFVFLAILGLIFLPMPWSLIPFLPYVVYRSMEPTKSLKGPLRLARPVFYSLRDVSSFAILLVSSIKAKRLVL